MQIALAPATIADTLVLDNLLQLYLYDLSEMNKAEIDDQGRFRYPELAVYWQHADCRPFLIRADDRLAGFALINRQSWLHDSFDGHVVAEFFIMRKYRRLGIGRNAAIQLFDRFAGRWEVGAPSANVPAQAFWRSTVDTYTGGRYQEAWVSKNNWRGYVQSFVAPS